MLQQQPSSPHLLLNPLAYIAEPDTAAPAATFNSTCYNSEDILTQSQMLKASDSDLFIASQHAEIENLVKTHVMEPHYIQFLPAHAKLISTIWSYHNKCLPNGKLLKHKARMCVNCKQQELGRDYWETYAPVAS